MDAIRGAGEIVGDGLVEVFFLDLLDLDLASERGPEGRLVMPAGAIPALLGAGAGDMAGDVRST